MATVLFCVRATIAAEREDEFNRWYDEEHCPQFLRFNGAVSARRYRAIMGEDEFRYMAVYELKDEATLERFLGSEDFRALLAEYDRNFGDVSERQRFAYVQVFP